MKREEYFFLEDKKKIFIPNQIFLQKWRVESMRYLITGGSGLLGTAFKNNYDDCIYLSSVDCDLRDAVATKKIFYDIKPEYVFHFAAKVGGLKANMDYMADFYIDNIRINTNVLDAAKEVKVKKLLSVLSTCIYPAKIKYPLTEDQLHNGLPHESNFGYAFAKRMLDMQSRAYRSQYNCNFISVISNNLFGENDNFDLVDSHVIPAIIRRIYEAKINNIDEVVFWGDGSPKREFTYAKDLAKIIWFVFNSYNGVEPINIGNTKEYKIKTVVKVISKIIKYKGKIVWDKNMPNGQMKKPSDNSKLLLGLGWDKNDYTDLESALKMTIEWFIENYQKKNVRGIF